MNITEADVGRKVVLSEGNTAFILSVSKEEPFTARVKCSFGEFDTQVDRIVDFVNT